MEASALILRRSDFITSGLDDRRLRRLCQRGELARVVAGAYVDTTTWNALTDRQRFVTKIHAAVSRHSGPVVVSHWSAAAVWGFPVPDQWPDHVEIIDPRCRESNRIPSLHRRPGLLDEGDVVEWEGLLVTNPARTAADLSLTNPFASAVLVFDHGLHVRAFDRTEVVEQLHRRPGARRRRAAAAALAFADASAEFAGESFSRVGMAERGIQTPRLQEPFSDRDGLIGLVDFWWESVGVVGEFDGQWKYTDDRWLKGRTPAQAFADEKRRQARLAMLPQVRQIVRWDYAVARNSDALARQLLAAGVPRAAEPRSSVAFRSTRAS